MKLSQETGSRPTAVALIALSLIVCTTLAYRNSLKVPFVLDDASAIVFNRSIATPVHWISVLLASDAGTASGRPLLNLSFALNRMVGRNSVLGYHVINLTIHLWCGLLLFGIVRRALSLNDSDDISAQRSQWIAATCALIWLLHPLETESVTYISERAESMMGLFYLLTLYSFIRAQSGDRTNLSYLKPDRRWLTISVFCCFLGMATKEVMVTAPIIVLFFDRAFISHSLSSALRKRGVYYTFLASSWVLLGALLTFDRLATRTVGFGFGVTAWSYLVTEAKALGIYGSLLVWPHPLIFDYGRECLVGNTITILPQLGIIAGIFIIVGCSWKRYPRATFVIASAFILLAPTSSIIPIAAQPIAESRMYLPSAAVIILLVSWLIHNYPRFGLIAAITVAFVMLCVTDQRNKVYGTSISIWADTVNKNPSSSRAQDNYGVALSKDPDRRIEAVWHFETALKIRPDFPEAERDLAVALSGIPGRADEAIAHFEKAIELRPSFPEAHNGLGVELGRIPGHSLGAIAHLSSALQIRPDYAEAHNNLAVELAKIPGQTSEAVYHYKEAISIQPDYAEAHNNLGVELASIPGRIDEGLEEIRRAIAIDPNYANARRNLAEVLATIPGQRDAAIAEFDRALVLAPDNVEANYGIGKLFLLSDERRRDGFNKIMRASELDPNRVDIHITLANYLVNTPGGLSASKKQYEYALRLQPNLPEGHNGLGVVLAKMGDIDGAIEEIEMSIRLRPSYQDAIDNLAALVRAKNRSR